MAVGHKRGVVHEVGCPILVIFIRKEKVPVCHRHLLQGTLDPLAVHHGGFSSVRPPAPLQPREEGELVRKSDSRVPCWAPICQYGGCCGEGRASTELLHAASPTLSEGRVHHKEHHGVTGRIEVHDSVVAFRQLAHKPGQFAVAVVAVVLRRLHVKVARERVALTILPENAEGGVVVQRKLKPFHAEVVGYEEYLGHVHLILEDLGPKHALALEREVGSCDASVYLARNHRGPEDRAAVLSLIVLCVHEDLF